MADWKKVAAQRLEKLKCLERQAAYLKTHLAKEIERELSTQLHAHCIQRREYAGKLKQMAEFVAERVAPYLF